MFTIDILYIDIDMYAYMYITLYLCEIVCVFICFSLYNIIIDLGPLGKKSN